MEWKIRVFELMHVFLIEWASMSFIMTILSQTLFGERFSVDYYHIEIAFFLAYEKALAGRTY